MQLRGLSDVVDFINSHDSFLIAHHHDADGLSAAAIIGKALERAEKSFTFLGLKQLDPTTIKSLNSEARPIIFVDFGSGQLPILHENLPSKAYCIIDHHDPNGETSSAHFNPTLSGFDGAREISGAGAAYFIAKELGANEDLAKIAIVGAVGDMQDSTGKLVGLNRKILEDAETSHDLMAKQDLRLFGRNSRPLIQFLSFCVDPYLPGLTANENACSEFITSLGIELRTGDRWNYYVDLTPDQKMRLVSALYIYGKQNRVPEYALRFLVGETYELINEPERTELRDSKEFATMLNACGRHGHFDVGVAVCMGDRGDQLIRARSILTEHRKALRNGIAWAQQNGAKPMKNIYVLDAGTNIEDTLVGVIAGMLYGSSVIGRDKPIIALALNDKDEIKVSGRGNRELITRGLNLNHAFRTAAAHIGGAGGGHDVAAGATVPKDKKDAFLQEVDRLVGEQLNVRI